MKNEIRSLKRTIQAGVALLALLPSLGFGLTFSNVWNDSSEAVDNSGAPNVYDELGLPWPGGGDILFSNNGVTTFSSAASMNYVCGICVWNYGSTESSYDTFTWLAGYRLNGEPDASANIKLDYEYYNSNFNAAFDGRSQSKMDAILGYRFVPASMYETELQKEDLSLFFSHLFIPFFPYPHYKYQGFSYNTQHKFAGLTNYDGTTKGSIALGTMTAGDYLFLGGLHSAKTEAQGYGPGLTIATLVSRFGFELGAEEVTPQPVPEPAIIVLISLGLTGIGFARKKKQS